jgi:hypothetical protein
MGKSLNVQNRASEKFKEISSAYQILKDYLRAEERKKGEQDRREREEQTKKKQDEEWRRKKKRLQFPTNCPICKESITINSTLSQSKTKIHFEVFCKFCKGTYLYFFKDGVPIFPLRSNDNYTESSKEDTFQKNENRGESMIWTIGVLVSKLLAFLLIVFLILFIGLTIFITIQPNDHSDSGSTAKIHKENHLSQSKLSNEIHALYEEVRLSRLSAEQGVAEAQYKMGNFYYTGKGVPRDYKEAVKWYRLAAEQGFAKAQTSLGGMYFDGLGVTQDHALAYMWLNNAGSNGDYEKETEKVDMGIWATEEN